MLVNELKTLATVGQLARLSKDEATVTLATDETGMYTTAYFQGLHVAALCSIPYGTPGLETPLAFSWEVLTKTLRLFGDKDPLTLSVKGGKLNLRTQSQQANLTPLGARPVFDLPPGPERQYTAEVAAMRQAALLLGEVASDEVDRVLLMGVRLVTAGQRLVMQATDGIGRAMLLAVPIERSALDDGGEMDAVVHAADLLAVFGRSEGTSLMQRDVRMGVSGRNVMFYDDATSVQVTTLQGAFPEFRFPESGRTTLHIPGSAIQTAVRASEALNDMGLVDIETDGAGTLIVGVPEEERGVGEYRQDFEGIDAEPIQLTFTGRQLKTIIGLGSTLHFHVTDERTPVKVMGEGERVVWLSPMFRLR